MRETTMAAGKAGHNTDGAKISFEVRLFNSLHMRGNGASGGRPLTLPAGATVADVLQHIGVQVCDVFLVLVNGKDITPDLGTSVRIDYAVQDGDVLAFSGPVPYSWGYGAPIV